jgi:hypothetical protein
VRGNVTIDAESTLALFDQVLLAHSQAASIEIIYFSGAICGGSSLPSCANEGGIG